MTDLRDRIAKRIAFLNDGMENTWHDYLQDAEACVEIIKEHIEPLLLNKTDINLRLSLGDLLGLKITFAPIQNDHTPKIHSQMSTRPPIRRREVRRRSSARDRFYQNGDDYNSLSSTTQDKVLRRMSDHSFLDSLHCI